MIVVACGIASFSRFQPADSTLPSWLSGTGPQSQVVFDDLEAVGIDLGDVFRHLEDDGVDKFEKSWQELLDATQGQLDAATR